MLASKRVSSRARLLGEKAGRKATRLLFALLLGWLLAAAACSETTCKTAGDCPPGEECLWLRQGDKVVGQACLKRCRNNDDCQSSQCSGKAASCVDCRDAIAVCQ